MAVLNQGEDNRFPLRRHLCAPHPRPCPWCERAVVMRLEREELPQSEFPESGVFNTLERDRAELLRILCPECGGAVTYDERNGDWTWRRHATGIVDSEFAEIGVPHCRPCLTVRCRHHLYLDVNLRTGSIKLNFPDREPEQLELSCALDVAEEGGAPLREVARAMNLTPERVRQIEMRALERIAEVVGDD